MSGPAQIRIVRTDAELECPIVDKALRARGYDLVVLPDGTCEDDLVEAVRDADLILMCYTPIPARVINAAVRLKGIVKYGVGIDAIDIDAARARGVPVVNVPEYAEETVAEAAFMLLMALAKKLMPLHAEMRRSGWAWPTDRWLGADIAGKTVGLVGVGRIGRCMARMAGAGFRANVLGYNPRMTAPDMAAHGIEKCEDLNTMLARCDFVSVHCVLNPDTRHMIGADQFACMKPGAVLINVSRGAIVDEAAMLVALQSGRLGGAGLDVFSKEPLALTGHPLSALFEMDNVIVMPHLAFYTDGAMQRLEEETLARCFEVLEGRPVLVRSTDPRLRAQAKGVRFGS